MAAEVLWLHPMARARIPYVALLLGLQDNRHGLWMDRLDHGVRSFANQTTSFFFVSGLGFSQARQCGEDVFLILVTG